LRRAVQQRASGRCEYCCFADYHAAEIFVCDHLVPICMKGKTVLPNLVYACPACNIFKGMAVSAIDPISRRRVRIYNPRRDRWKRHFRWSDDKLGILGRTASGRATFALLRMNRDQAANLRFVLLKAGVHPAAADHNDDAY
jgi:hypothetical protein